MYCVKQTWNCMFWELVGKNLAHQVWGLASTGFLPCMARGTGRIFERIISSAGSHHFLTYSNGLLNQCLLLQTLESIFLMCYLRKIVMQNSLTVSFVWKKAKTIKQENKKLSRWYSWYRWAVKTGRTVCLQPSMDPCANFQYQREGEVPVVDVLLVAFFLCCSFGAEQSLRKGRCQELYSSLYCAHLLF